MPKLRVTGQDGEKVEFTVEGDLERFQEILERTLRAHHSTRDAIAAAKAELTAPPPADLPSWEEPEPPPPRQEPPPRPTRPPEPVPSGDDWNSDVATQRFSVRLPRLRYLLLGALALLVLLPTLVLVVIEYNSMTGARTSFHPERRPILWVEAWIHGYPTVHQLIRIEPGDVYKDPSLLMRYTMFTFDVFKAWSEGYPTPAARSDSFDPTSGKSPPK